MTLSIGTVLIVRNGGIKAINHLEEFEDTLPCRERERFRGFGRMNGELLEGTSVGDRTMLLLKTDDATGNGCFPS